MEFPKKYDPKVSEKKWQEFWKKNKTYTFDNKSKKPVFSIDTPPPTVSGAMHMGHAFSYTHQDIIARNQTRVYSRLDQYRNEL
jgi:valyl-tRNA synthetase